MKLYSQVAHYLGFLIYMLSLLIFYNADSFIKILVGIEAISLALILNMCLFFSSYYFIIFILIFGVCEGVLGLGILIIMLSSYGCDQVVIKMMMF